MCLLDFAPSCLLLGLCVYLDLYLVVTMTVMIGHLMMMDELFALKNGEYYVYSGDRIQLRVPIYG
jgi:hypothetical protein